MSLLNQAITSLRVNLQPLSAGRWWRPLGGLAAIVALAAAALICASLEPSWWLAMLIWVAVLLPIGMMNIKGWNELFGPVLFYDMVRQARRGRFIALRFAFVLTLVAVLYTVWGGLAGNRLTLVGAELGSTIARSFFELFIVAQFVVVGLLTPVCVAGSIAEEKERKTLDFLLATELNSREIVLGKLVSRLAYLAMFVLAGLPIVSILQFLGGVDPNLVLASFALTILTALSQAGVSIVCSVYCKSAARAIALAYFLLLAFNVVPLLIPQLTTPHQQSAKVWFGHSTNELLELHAKGSIRGVLDAVMLAGNRGTMASDLPVLVADYAVAHLPVALFCIILAVVRLRVVAAAENVARPIKARADILIWSRPRIGSNALLWKELHCGGSVLPPWAAAMWMAVKLVGTFVPALFIVGLFWAWFGAAAYLDRRNLNWWMSAANAAVGSLTIVAIAVRAAACISKEREKRTLDTLLTTPFSTSAIVRAKLIGSLLSLRLGMVWMLVVWAASIVSGAVRIEGIVVVAVIWSISAVFSAALGVWFSTTSLSSLHAAVQTVIVLVGLSVGPVAASWIIGDFSAARNGGSLTDRLTRSPVAGFSPAVLLFLLPYSNPPAEIAPSWASWGQNPAPKLALYIWGPAVWLPAAVFLLQGSQTRFDTLANRIKARPAPTPPWLGADLRRGTSTW